MADPAVHDIILLILFNEEGKSLVDHLDRSGAIDV